MKYIVVDLEMNPLGREFKKEREICISEIIEIGAVMLDEQYHEIGHFMTLVKPQMNAVIERQIEKLTGITTKSVECAPCFQEAVEMFFDWCQSIPGKIEIIQWSDSDHAQFMSEALLKGYRWTKEQTQLLSGWKDFQKEYDDRLRQDSRGV